MFIFVSVVCYVGGDDLIAHPGESYKLCWFVCLIVGDLEFSIMRQCSSGLGCWTIKKYFNDYWLLL